MCSERDVAIDWKLLREHHGDRIRPEETQTMDDFSRSDAVDGSAASDEERVESQCFDMKEVQREIFKLDEGLDLIVTHDRKTMRSVANLVLAVSKMKKPQLQCSLNELSGDELLGVIMDCVVEETIVSSVRNSSTTERTTFQRADSWMQCKLCDLSQKDIVRSSGQLKLQAINLNGGHDHHKVSFKMARYSSHSDTDGDSTTLTVVLSITNNLHMSCSMKDGTAELVLEECRKEELTSISDDRARFLFYKKNEGLDMCRFESVKYRGWFISTADTDNQPVEMCTQDTERRNITFKERP